MGGVVMAVIRKIIAHVIHAQGTKKSYEQIFSSLARLSPADRVFQLDYQVVGIPNIWEITDGFLIQFAEGTPGVNPFVLDASSGATRVEPLGRSEVLSDVSHALVYPRRREAAIEYVKRGAKAAVMSTTIEGIMRSRFDDMKNFRIEFTPRIREGFIREINRFERIRIAELIVTQPNAGWTDHYNELSDLLDKSDGDTARLDVRAGRGESLKKTSGVVKVIKDISNDATPYLKDAKITGTRSGDASETTVSLQNHVEHKRVSVQTDADGQPVPQSLISRMRSFLRNTTGS
jgi:hypothetical protein